MHRQPCCRSSGALASSRSRTSSILSPMLGLCFGSLGRRAQERLGLKTAKRDRTRTPFSKLGGVQLQNWTHRNLCKASVLGKTGSCNCNGERCNCMHGHPITCSMSGEEASSNPQHLRRQERSESCLTALKNEANRLLRKVIQAASVFDASVDALVRGACV